MDTIAPEAGYLNKNIETMAWDRRRERLEKRFVEAFRRCLDNSKAYRDIYERAGVAAHDVNSLEDLDKLPIVRMDELVERQKQDPPWGGFLTAGEDQVRRIYVNPGLIFQPGEHEYSDTSWAEAVAAAGFGPGDRVINTFNYHLWPFAMMLDESLKMVGATTVPTGVGNSFMQIRIMQRLKVNGFLGTPSFLMTLTQRAEVMGIDAGADLNLERALVGAEKLPESMRAQLQETLGISIRQAYGTVLLGCLGYECQHLTGMHVPDNVLVEVIDPHTGRSVPPGSAGEIVATNFNPLYPLIRFSTGDLGLVADKTCPCGRTGPMLEKVLGRIDQATKVHGTFIHHWQTDEVVARYPEVFKYQVVVTRQNHTDVMTFVVELSQEVENLEAFKSRLETTIKDLLTIKGRVEIVERGTIPDFHDKIVDKRSWE